MDFATFNSAFIPHGKWLWGELSELAQRYRIFSSYYYKREKINKISRSRELIQVPFLHRREFVIFLSPENEWAMISYSFTSAQKVTPS
jgi:hypothetical protein